MPRRLSALEQKHEARRNSPRARIAPPTPRWHQQLPRRREATPVDYTAGGFRVYIVVPDSGRRYAPSAGGSSSSSSPTPGPRQPISGHRARPAPAIPPARPDPRPSSAPATATADPQKGPTVKRLRQHLRSNVVAYLALFVALGGTGYAAMSLPANSVGPRQIRNRSITGVKLNPRSIAASVQGVGECAGFAEHRSRCRVEQSDAGVHHKSERRRGVAAPALLEELHRVGHAADQLQRQRQHRLCERPVQARRTTTSSCSGSGRTARDGRRPRS